MKISRLLWALGTIATCASIKDKHLGTLDCMEICETRHTYNMKREMLGTYTVPVNIYLAPLARSPKSFPCCKLDNVFHLHAVLLGECLISDFLSNQYTLGSLYRDVDGHVIQFINASEVSHTEDIYHVREFTASCRPGMYSARDSTLCYRDINLTYLDSDDPLADYHYLINHSHYDYFPKHSNCNHLQASDNRLHDPSDPSREDNWISTILMAFVLFVTAATAVLIIYLSCKYCPRIHIRQHDTMELLENEISDDSATPESSGVENPAVENPEIHI